MTYEYDVEALSASASTSPVEVGGTATFSCSVSGAAGAELSYLWQFSQDGGETWRALGWEGARTDYFEAGALGFRGGTAQDRCVVT